MAITQIIGIVGLTSSAVTVAVTRAMQGRAREIESGQFVQEQLRNYGISDRWAPYLVDVGGGGATCPLGSYQRGWGMRDTSASGERPHGAVDICGPQGTGVHALRSGIVEHSGQKTGYGECILLRHADGTTSIYCHLNDRLVEQGAVVTGGVAIARMGRTSKGGTKPANVAQQGGPSDPRCRHFPNMGVHLHFGTHGYPKQLNGQTVRRPLPHALTVGQAFSTDSEWTYGADPLVVLQQANGGQGVRFQGRLVGACPTWSSSWAG